MRALWVSSFGDTPAPTAGRIQKRQAVKAGYLPRALACWHAIKEGRKFMKHLLSLEKMSPDEREKIRQAYLENFIKRLP